MINKKGFVKRRKNIGYDIYILIFAVILFVILIVSPKIAKEPYTRTQITRVNTLPECDEKLVTGLKNRLKKREGLALKKYKSKGVWYIGYGHRIKRGDNFGQITEKQADSILDKDIKQAHFEVLRVNRKKMIDRMYNVFISGKYYN